MKSNRVKFDLVFKSVPAVLIVSIIILAEAQGAWTKPGEPASLGSSRSSFSFLWYFDMYEVVTLLFCFTFLVGAVVGFKNRSLGVIVEGQSRFLIVDGTGFSYGDIPFRVTPFPCSEYPGNLSALFNDLPAISASLSMCEHHAMIIISTF